MKKSKNILCLLAAAVMIFSLAGCKKKDNGGTNATPDGNQNANTNTNALSTGLGIATSLDGSSDAGDDYGRGVSLSVVSAVVLDSSGAIVDIRTDAIWASVEFDSSGKLAERESSNVSPVSSGSDELESWRTQLSAVNDWAKGRTLDEIKAIKVKDGAVSDGALSGRLTKQAQTYVDSLTRAVDNAQMLGAQNGDTLGLAVTGSTAESTDAGDADGLARSYNSFAVVTVDKSGIITSCIIDSVQADVGYDEKGEIISDLDEEPLSKNMLKEDYGMKKASAIKKEWYEQAQALSQYAVGKTAKQAAAIELDSGGRAADPDLVSSVTIHIDGLVKLIGQAAQTPTEQ